MFVVHSLINAIYALYGKPEPNSDTGIVEIIKELDRMAEEKRRKDEVKQIAENL
jgi:hypothetical protein